MGLSVTLDVEQEQYYCSSSSSVGFKVALHAPNETPNLRETGIFIEPGKETHLRLLPIKRVTDNNLRSTKVHLRHCLFLGEGNLTSFAHYTQRNCEMECAAATCLKHCNCIFYYMPKIYNNASLCGISEVQCMRNYHVHLDNQSKSCLDHCLPACYELTFQMKTFSTKLAPRGYIVNSKYLGNRSRDYIVENVAVVHMFFKENSFRSNVKKEYIGISDFLCTYCQISRIHV